MNRLLAAGAAAALSFSLSACVQAQSPERTSFDGLVGSRTVDTDGDVEMNGVAVTLRGRVGGDVEMNGASVDMRADVGGDVEANGASAELDGDIRGRTLVNAGSARLMGGYTGPVEVNAGAAELRGSFNRELLVRAGRVDFQGDAAAPVRFLGDGARHGWRDRGDDSKVRVRGALHAGGTICAHEVRFEPNARVLAPLTVISDDAPLFETGFDASNVRHEPRQGDCD
ncbi:MAG: hypothetical protein ACFE0P_01400 [Oceanicaulis sp.]